MWSRAVRDAAESAAALRGSVGRRTRASGGMADAHGSGPCVLTDVGVQLPPRPPTLLPKPETACHPFMVGRRSAAPIASERRLPGDEHQAVVFGVVLEVPGVPRGQRRQPVVQLVA